MVRDAVEETQIGEAESDADDIQFVEAGYICNVHGLRGEVRVKPATDFPEERFLKPGVRWLRLRSSSTLMIKEFELVKGRFHAAQHQWLVTFKGVNSVDEARELVGAALLVKFDDRPTLNDDEFYSPDLVGMNVVLKDTGELVGTVIDIYNTGASDLLRVMLSQTKDSVANISAAASEEESSAPLIWIPFVKDIVPDVDMQRRQLLITPPEGLLELNLRPKSSSKGEKHQEERKQRRKARQKVAAIRKKLLDIGQEHVLFGLSIGDKAQKQALLDQILSFDFKLFKHALQDSSETYQRSDLSQLMDTKLTTNWWLSSDDFRKGHVPSWKKESVSSETLQLHREGLELIAQGQIAVIIFVDEENLKGDNADEHMYDQRNLALRNRFHLQAEKLLTSQKLANSAAVENFSVPCIISATEDKIPSIQLLFEEHDYFGLEEEQVWFSTQESLPCIGMSSDSRESKILLESPWKIIQAPAGPGSIVGSLLNQRILERLTEMDIQYVQICSLNDLSVVADPGFFGFVHKQGAAIGVKLFAEEFPEQSEQLVGIYHVEVPSYSLSCQNWKKGYASSSEGAPQSDAQAQLFVKRVHNGSPCYDMILSTKYLGKLTKKLYKMEYYREEKHVDYLNEENAETQNATQLQCSIYSLLKFSPSNKIALILYH